MTIISADIDHQKIKSDLNFLGKFMEFAKTQNWRVVVSGGYGLDGYLRVMTRRHGDLDLIIYGLTNRKDAEDLITSYLQTHFQSVEVTTKSELFSLDIDVHHPGFVGNFYYVQTVADPFVDVSQVRKADGTLVNNSPTDFPPPVNGKLLDLEVEVQDQRAHLSDILHRRSYDVAQSKHDQDLANINRAQTKEHVIR